MFEKTFSFWQRIVGTAPSPHKASTPENRRLWVRYPTDLKGKVQVGQHRHAEKILAQVRDLSLGGANLVLDQPLQPGQMLSLDLPAANGETRTVLACVVRAASLDDTSWAIGCAFARELDRDALDEIDAGKGKADQRICVRYECALRAKCRKFGDPVSAAQPIKVLNISHSGIGLLVPPTLETGSLLTLDLLDKTGRAACTILACVVHTAQRKDGNIAIGCNFIRELTEEELASLL